MAEFVHLSDVFIHAIRDKTHLAWVARGGKHYLAQRAKSAKAALALGKEMVAKYEAEGWGVACPDGEPLVIPKSASLLGK